jgi:hypothetical protein
MMKRQIVMVASAQASYSKAIAAGRGFAVTTQGQLASTKSCSEFLAFKAMLQSTA